MGVNADVGVAVSVGAGVRVDVAGTGVFVAAPPVALPPPKLSTKALLEPMNHNPMYPPFDA